MTGQPHGVPINRVGRRVAAADRLAAWARTQAYLTGTSGPSVRRVRAGGAGGRAQPSLRTEYQTRSATSRRSSLVRARRR
jgi:hypothetical protein